LGIFGEIQLCLLSSMGDQNINKPTNMFKIAKSLLSFHNDTSNEFRIRKKNIDSKSYIVDSFINLIEMNCEDSMEYHDLINSKTSVFEINQTTRIFINEKKLKLNQLIQFIKEKISNEKNKLLILLEYIHVTGKDLEQELKECFPNLLVKLLDGNCKDLQNDCTEINNYEGNAVVLLGFKSGSVGIDLFGCNYVIIYEMVCFLLLSFIFQFNLM
jgi:hypothetical protein